MSCGFLTVPPEDQKPDSQQRGPNAAQAENPALILFGKIVVSIQTVIKILASDRAISNGIKLLYN